MYRATTSAPARDFRRAGLIKGLSLSLLADSIRWRAYKSLSNIPLTEVFSEDIINGLKLLNTKVAAKALRISARRVRALIEAGTLSAHRIGREYAIEASALTGVRTYGKPGRPPKKLSLKK